MAFKVGFRVSIECFEDDDTPRMRAAAEKLMAQLSTLVAGAFDSDFAPTHGSSRMAAKSALLRMLSDLLASTRDDDNYMVSPAVVIESPGDFAFVVLNRWSSAILPDSLVCREILYKQTRATTWEELASEAWHPDGLERFDWLSHPDRDHIWAELTKKDLWDRTRWAACNAKRATVS